MEYIERTVIMKKNYMQELMASVGVSGYEEKIRSLLIEKLSGASADIHTDSVGNLICFRKGTD